MKHGATLAAVRHLEMWPVMKVSLRFHERFWSDRLDRLGFLRTPEGGFRSWWGPHPVQAPLLVAWAGGPPAVPMSRLSDEEVVDVALAELGPTFGLGPRDRRDLLRASYFHNWQTDPFAGGAYSYVTVGGRPAQAVLARPVDGTLFFAGEATELTGHHATVHSALATGERAAAEAIARLAPRR